MSKKQHNFQLVYPNEGDVCKSNSLKEGAKKCYKEFKRLNDINEGMFTIKDLDRGKDYTFKVLKNKMYPIRDQTGGADGDAPKPKVEAIPLATEAKEDQNKQPELATTGQEPKKEAIPLATEESSKPPELAPEEGKIPLATEDEPSFCPPVYSPKRDTTCPFKENKDPVSLPLATEVEPNPDYKMVVVCKKERPEPSCIIL